MGSKASAVHHIFDRYLAWRLDNYYSDRIIVLDYPVDARPRYSKENPHPELARLFDSNRVNFRHWLDVIGGQADRLAAIARSDGNPGEPTFRNVFLSGLDAIALYCMVAHVRPARLIEVGSGHSTTFARRAIRDHALSTRIISIDPNPRADIEALCDEAIRSPLERSDLHIFDRAAAGDIVFIDNSHRCFMNSDVTVFFLEVLPRLKPGVIIHVHDIFLPFDYPSEWSSRFYSEQYLLACHLLAAPERLELMLANAFVLADPELSSHVLPLLGSAAFEGARRFMAQARIPWEGAGSFWAKIR